MFRIHGPAEPVFEPGSFCLSSPASTFIYGMQAWLTAKLPVRLTSTYFFHASIVDLSAIVFPSGQYGDEIPALLIKKSTRSPRNCTASSTASLTASVSDKSQCFQETRSEYCFRWISAVCLRPSWLMSTRNSLWPLSAKCRAVARPIPGDVVRNSSCQSLSPVSLSACVP